MINSLLIKLLVVLSLASANMASPIAFHHLKKRAITQTAYITAAEYVTTTIEVSEGENKDVSTTSSATSTGSISYATASVTSSYISSSAASSTSTSSSASSSASSSSQVSNTTESGSKGITYSPYTSSGGCKDLSTVKSDFAKLTDFDVIRIYDTDCSQVENVLQAKSDSQKIFVGIFYVSSIDSSVSTIASAVGSYGSWDDIYAVSVGNELVNNNEASVSDIQSYISQAKSALSAHNYNGKVVSVDTFNAVIAHTELCTAGDFIAINAHAFFDSTCSAANAGEWLKKTIEEVASACNVDSDQILITESGWPSAGNDNGDAIPGEDNQTTAISAIKETVGDQVLLFTAFNDLWKQPGAFDVEQHFGILS
ncbi:hypothetical protein DASC09_014400 [Saccharomycopsis crataegensis]|uniref:Uncharacterized protein n=1 Tax=Saccharomycopsis crataegensis TaxID=43959 RepID=A0AAV5QIA1_9ASCO|nr:hypothetical protein DASC09_014400 [Saccharomycopsis crataegensis]